MSPDFGSKNPLESRVPGCLVKFGILLEMGGIALSGAIITDFIVHSGELTSTSEMLIVPALSLLTASIVIYLTVDDLRKTN